MLMVSEGLLRSMQDLRDHLHLSIAEVEELPTGRRMQSLLVSPGPRLSSLTVNCFCLRRVRGNTGIHIISPFRRHSVRAVHFEVIVIVVVQDWVDDFDDSIFLFGGHVLNRHNS